MASPHYQAIGLGGTFDHFHAGHAAFLKFAGELADLLVIGLTTEQLNGHKKYAFSIESFDQRRANVQQFCDTHHINCQIVELHDVYGPTLHTSHVQALAVTIETQAGAQAINDKRLELGLSSLPVHVCHLLQDETGQDLHSERIRAGQVNRQGQVYTQVFQKELKLNQDQRDFFAQPQGEIVLQPIKVSGLIAVVGDYTLEHFIKNNWSYNLGIYDQSQQRQPYTSSLIANQVIDNQVPNQAGFISLQLIEALNKALSQISVAKPYHLLVDGEEDLAAVALFLLLPLNSVVYYGQPHQGTVAVSLTEEFKNRVYQVLSDV